MHQISIHFIVSFTDERYSLGNIVGHFKKDSAYTIPDKIPAEISPILDEEAFADNYERANATFVILCRNSDLGGTVRSVREIEDRFNRKYRYPYVFLNEEPFSNEFKE